MMSKLILTMCGTSALFEHSDWRNGKKWEKQEDLIKELETEASNNKSNVYNHQKKQIIESLNQNLSRYCENGEKGLNTLSAEVASLLAMEKDNEIGAVTQDDKIILLRSDTIDGQLCAEANEEVIKENEKLKAWEIEIHKIDGLQPKDAVKFVENGLNNLLRKIKELIDSHNGYHVFINITGGYKGAIPVLSRIAIALKIPLVYLFENCTEIIRMDISGKNPTIAITDTSSGRTEETSIDWFRRHE